MIWLEALVAAAMGAAALSFVQLAVDRAAGGVGLLKRSRCPRCATELRARDVLPIAGFLLLRGRCRSCGVAIPRRYLAGEVTVGAFWAGAVVLAGPVVWLPVVLVAPLVVVLLRSPLRDAGRVLVAGLLPPVGVALLTFGLVGLLEGRWAAYGAGGLLGAGALLAGVAVAHGAAAASGAGGADSHPKVSHDRLSQPRLNRHLPRV